MRAVTRFACACAASLLLAASGCAPAYHHYSDYRINCRYCAPPPLPYMHYEGCVCHSCAASEHLAIPPQPVRVDAETDADHEAE